MSQIEAIGSGFSSPPAGMFSGGPPKVTSDFESAVKAKWHGFPPESTSSSGTCCAG